ncbi:MAG: hypothetical protein AB1757_25245 [Acidobacteriota bacterium]
MESLTLPMLIGLIVGLTIGFGICWLIFKRRESVKNELSERDLTNHFAAARNLETIVMLEHEVAEKSAKLSALDQDVKTNVARLTALEEQLTTAQHSLKAKDEELAVFEERLRINKSDLEYTATLESRLLESAKEFQLKLSDKDLEILRLQERLESFEKTSPAEKLEALTLERDALIREKTLALEQKNAEVQELQNAVNALVQEYTDAKAEMSGQLQAVEAKLAEKDAELERLQAQLEIFQKSDLPLLELDRESFIDAKLADLDATYQKALHEKDAEISQLLDHLKSVDNLGALMAERDAKLQETEAAFSELQSQYQTLESETSARQAAFAALKKRADEFEQLSKRNAESFGIKLQEAEDQHRQSLEEKEAELAELRERVGFVGALRKQYAEKEAELQSLDEKYQTTLNNKNLEIHFLKEHLDNLEKLQTSSIDELRDNQQSLLAEQENRIAELEAGLIEKDSLIEQWQAKVFELEQSSAGQTETSDDDLRQEYETRLQAKETEITELLERITALETLFAAHSEEVDLKFKEKEAELTKLREDARALEVFVGSHSEEVDRRLQEAQAKYKTAVIAKNAEISRLQMRINQLEPFSALVAQRDARIREMDNRYQTAISTKDAEIQRLQNKLRELNGNAHMAS